MSQIGAAFGCVYASAPLTLTGSDSIILHPQVPVDRCENASVFASVRASPAKEAESPTKDFQHRPDLLHKPKADCPLFLLHRARRSSFSFAERKRRGGCIKPYREWGAQKRPAHAMGEKAPACKAEKIPVPGGTKKFPRFSSVTSPRSAREHHNKISRGKTACYFF